MTTASSSVEAYLIVRHGETEWSSSGRHTGRTDLELTEAGQIEAMSAGALIAAELGIDQPAAVFSSPRRRARDTARLAMRGVASDELAPVVTDTLVEFDYGDFEGLTAIQISEARPGWDLWRDGCPGGETPDDVRRRVDEFVELAEATTRERDGGIVVAFTHGHFSRALVSMLLGFPITAANTLINDTASLAVVRRRRAALTLSGWNIRPQGAAPRPH
ncbi:MAG: histidine phosphatase family protein [Acidimicrobiia bacterium]